MFFASYLGLFIVDATDVLPCEGMMQFHLHLLQDLDEIK